MKAYTTKNIEKGKAAPLQIIEREKPQAKNDEVVIAIKAIGVNRSDYFTRQGLYPLRPGIDSDIIGTEVSGIIESIGKNANKFHPGDKVCCVTPYGGAYAEFVAVPENDLLRIPDNLSFEQAAALPVGLVTGWHNIFEMGKLKSGEKVLIHGGTSGMGTIAIQMCRELGAKVFATAGGAQHCRICEGLGARAIDYKKDGFEKHAPYDVIYDILGGGEYFARNVSALNKNGRLRIISFIGGAKTNTGIYLGNLYNKGGQFEVSKSGLLKAIAEGNYKGETDFFKIVEMIGSGADPVAIGGDTVRRLPPEEKAEIIKDIESKIMPLVRAEKIKPIIEKTYDFADAESAHAHLATPSGHVGKLVLKL